ncbi:uncharacterized protein WM294_007499 [Sarcoramphus papa]
MEATVCALLNGETTWTSVLWQDRDHTRGWTIHPSKKILKEVAIFYDEGTVKQKYMFQPAWCHPPAPQPSGTGSRAAVAASLLSGAVILALSVSFAVCCWRDRARRSRGGQQHRRKVRGGRQKRDRSAPERGRNAFGRLKHYHRRDYHLSALSSSVFPGAFAGCNNLAFQRSPENLPKLPLQSWDPEAQVLPQLALQPGTPPITTLPSQAPRNILLPAMPCHADLPRDLLPLYYRSCEEHKLFNKFGRPI